MSPLIKKGPGSIYFHTSPLLKRCRVQLHTSYEKKVSTYQSQLSTNPKVTLFKSLNQPHSQPTATKTGETGRSIVHMPHHTP